MRIFEDTIPIDLGGFADFLDAQLFDNSANLQLNAGLGESDEERLITLLYRYKDNHLATNPHTIVGNDGLEYPTSNYMYGLDDYPVHV